MTPQEADRAVTAEIRNWRFDPPLGSRGIIPNFLEGFIFDDRSGVDPDGKYVRIGNLMYVIDRGEWYLTGTNTKVYKCFKSEEGKHGVVG